MRSIHLSELWRYPVKSMAGEQLSHVGVGSAGLHGDRSLALRDRSTGLVASAKHPGLWSALLECRAKLDPVAGAVRLTLPDGTSCASTDPDVDQLLSDALGRPVAVCATAPEDAAIERVWTDVAGLASDGSPGAGAVTAGGIAAAAPEGTFFDFAPVHVVTAATLAELARLAGAGRRTVDVRRFRPNLVLDGALIPFEENGWPGRRMIVGQVELRVLAPSPRCIVPSLAQDGLPADREVLRAIARHNRVEVLDLGRFGCVGVYAEVVRAGRIRRGDQVDVEGEG